MKQHTDAYTHWSAISGPFLHHSEWVSDDREIDVRARKNKFGDIQVFNGVYDKNGALKMEEYHPDAELKTLEEALAWGISRTRSFAAEPR
ncbi:hypothetical protein ALQ48_03904 [Pseudomonas coronafaciens pv. zizaniae]|uniref:hypothetical protein n=1 Tax=Pseudomonas syringae group TaxID=136849 RepID=UPI0006D62AA3|nr:MULTISPECIES: hypothetical protein [Pseudomonas syringae group]RMO02869.1 hypothetical protein ALQ48_03904 [Pseudomonas coronafaciens pv. zizaniae]